MDEERLFRELGGMQKQLDKLCENDGEQKVELKELKSKIDSKFEGLPCHAQYENCQQEMKKKVNWAVLSWILGFIIAISLGAYGYTWESNKEHRRAIENKHPVVHIAPPETVGGD